MKTIFISIVSDDWYLPSRTDDFIKSFKHFHPEIELKIFREQEIKETFATDARLNYYNSKATFALKFIDNYDLVVWIDVDHLIFGRLDSILENRYAIAAPSNFNKYQNTSIGEMDEKHYFNGGIIASGSKPFWELYEHNSLNWAMEYSHKDNDILNLLLKGTKLKNKYLDGSNDFNDDGFKEYYGCASLGQESEVKIVNNRPEIHGKPIKAYHFAKGDKNKPHPKDLFNQDVINWINENINLNY